MTKTESIAVIIETVCTHYSVSYDQLQSKSRKAPLPECRALIWTIARNKFFKQTSYAYLGSLFGRTRMAVIKQEENLTCNVMNVLRIIDKINSKIN